MRLRGDGGGQVHVTGPAGEECGVHLVPAHAIQAPLLSLFEWASGVMKLWATLFTHLPGTVRDVAALQHFVQWKTPHVLASDCYPDGDSIVFEVCRGSSCLTSGWITLQVSTTCCTAREPTVLAHLCFYQ